MKKILVMALLVLPMMLIANTVPVANTIGMPSGKELIVIFVMLTFLLIPIIIHFRQEKVVLGHPTLSTIKEVPFIYSWSSLIFSFFVPLLRGDIKWFFIYLIFGLLTKGLSNIVLAFFYNKFYIKSMIEKGYIPANERTNELLVSKDIVINTKIPIVNQQS